MAERLLDRIKEEGIDVIRFTSTEDILKEYKEMSPYDKRSFMMGLSNLIERLYLEKNGAEQDKRFIENNKRFFDEDTYWQTHDKYIASKIITEADIDKFNYLLEEIRKINARKKK